MCIGELYLLWVGKYQYDIHKTLDNFKKREFNDINECSDLEILSPVNVTKDYHTVCKIYDERSNGMESDLQKK